MLFGGVLPWENRVDRIALFLKKSEADILFLQEVFSTTAGNQLYSKLKEQYAHFYLHIGPKISGFDAKNFGIPSGLFVASKYPLENPHFLIFIHRSMIFYKVVRGDEDFVFKKLIFMWKCFESSFGHVHLCQKLWDHDSLFIDVLSRLD